MVLDLSQQSMLGSGVSADSYNDIVRGETSLFGLETDRFDAAAWEAWNAASNEQVKQKDRLDFRLEELAATAGAKWT